VAWCDHIEEIQSWQCDVSFPCNVPLDLEVDAHKEDGEGKTLFFCMFLAKRMKSDFPWVLILPFEVDCTCTGSSDMLLCRRDVDSYSIAD
jgi:hypothetical protein